MMLSRSAAAPAFRGRSSPLAFRRHALLRPNPSFRSPLPTMQPIRGAKFASVPLVCGQRGKLTAARSFSSASASTPISVDAEPESSEALLKDQIGRARLYDYPESLQRSGRRVLLTKSKYMLGLQ